MDYLENQEENPDSAERDKSSGRCSARMSSIQRKQTGVKINSKAAQALAKRYSELSIKKKSSMQMSTASPYGMDPNYNTPNDQVGAQANSALARYQESGRKQEPKPEIFAEQYDVQHTYFK